MILVHEVHTVKSGIPRPVAYTAQHQQAAKVNENNTGWTRMVLSTIHCSDDGNKSINRDTRSLTGLEPALPIEVIVPRTVLNFCKKKKKKLNGAARIMANEL